MEKLLEIIYIGVLPPHTGGAAIASAQVLEGLAQKGHKIQAVTPVPDDLKEAAGEYAASHPEIAVTGYPVPRLGLNPMVPFPEDYRNHEGAEIRKALSGLVQASAPDLIIVGRESFAWHVPRIARSCSIPSVLVCHGGTLIGIQQGTHSEELKSQFFQGVDIVSCVVTVADHLRDFLVCCGYRKVRAIRNGVDVRKFSPAKRDREITGEIGAVPDDILVLFPAVLKSQKRPLDLVASAVLALKRRSNLLFLFAGPEIIGDVKGAGIGGNLSL